MNNVNIAKWTLIAGLAFVFITFGIDKFVTPEVWIGWMPLWMDGLAGLNVNAWMGVIAMIEIALGVMLIVPVRIVQKTGALLVALYLVGILSHTGWNNLAVRDGGLLAGAVALWYLL